MNFFYKVLSRIGGLFGSMQDDNASAGYISSILHHSVAQRKPLSNYRVRKKIFPLAAGDYPVMNAGDRTRIYGWFNAVSRVKVIEGDIVEAGTGFGNTAITLLTANRLFHAQKQVHCFDSFEGFPLPHANDYGSRVKKNSRVSGWEHNSEEIITEAAGNDPLLIIHKGYFAETMSQLPVHIALLHIDCDLYESTQCVVENAYPRLSPGAVVVIDEYHDEKWPGVRKAIDEFLKDKQEKPEYIEELLRYGFIKSVH